MQMVVLRQGRWPVDLRCASLGSKAGRTGNAGLGHFWVRLGGEFTCLQAVEGTGRVHVRYSAVVERLVVAGVAPGSPAAACATSSNLHRTSTAPAMGVVQGGPSNVCATIATGSLSWS